MKKGQVLEVIPMIGIVLTLIVILAMSWVLLAGASDLFPDDAKTEVYNKTVDRAFSTFSFIDVLVPFIFFAVLGVVAISLFFIRTRPEFFIFSILISLVVLLVGSVYSNFLSKFFVSIDASSGLNLTEQLTWTVWFNQNMMIVVAVAIFIILGALYIKLRGGELA